MDPISSIAGLANTLITKIWPDPKDQATAEAMLIKTQMDAALAQAQQQIDINKIEAGSTNIFVSGWRPFVGWACGAAFAYFAGPPLTAMLALASPGAAGAVGFGLGLFGVSVTNLAMVTLTDLRPRLVDAVSSWLTKR